MNENLDAIIAQIKGSLDIILDYSGIEESEKEEVKKHINAFTELKDRTSSDDAVRILRRTITKEFYAVYKRVFFKTLQDDNMPAPVKMFMYFGYMDEKLAGAENAILLCQLAGVFGPDPNKHIFTFYEWLKEIYYGRRDPSVNEMSLDYVMTLHQQKVEGRITEAQEKELLANGVKRVEFEIDNVFFSASKIVSGQVTVFCPVFADHQLFKPLDKTLVSYKAVYDYINKVRSIDFGCFYREQVYTNPDIGLPREYVQTEIIPDVILLPSIGSRGAMWQEIAGRKRTTPARFILPFFLNEELDRIIVRMCGEFRWELCRRIQGARWNDLSDPSLTAEYCDYMETFRRNRELTPEQKEKIKSDYRKYRNSIKEMFVHDYMDFIIFESRGSLRVNKVVRAILFKYCPFRKAIREELSKNGMYTKVIERYVMKNSHALHLSDMLFQKLSNGNHDVPVEIRAHRMFLES